MNHLIISAHPSEKSFSNYLANKLDTNSKAYGWNSLWTNLYKTDFNPVLSPTDLQLLKDGETPLDIYSEQQEISNADIISIIYPLWWASFPAVLKGYIDRVLTNGFAYTYGGNGATGLLKDKKVIIHTTMGNTVEEYEQKGLIEAFKRSQGEEVFGFCGMEILGHNFYPQITIADELQRNKYIEKALEVYQPLWRKSTIKKMAI